MKKSNEIPFEKIKQIQMEVLEAVHEFCIDNNIKYSLACGTLLGAARHKGYIPWDDDIDIYLLRDDYNKLISSFPIIYKNKYKIISLERNKEWDRPYAKAYDEQTVLIESGSFYEIGVNIDIFPIDDVPDNKIKWRRYDFLRRIIQNAYILRFINISQNRTLLKNLVIILNRIFTGLLSKRRFAKLISSFAQIFNKSGNSLCFECVQGVFQKKPFKKTLFDNLELLDFENKRFLGFQDYDEYLKAGFGDWRKLPPIEKQVSHHSFRAYYK